MARIGRPLMPTPAATAASRASAGGRPRLLEPSPETSITRRPPSKPDLGNRVMAKSIAPLMEVPPLNSWRGARSMASATASMVASSAMRVHGTTTTCRAGPVHCTMVTATAPTAPPRTARSSSRLRKAAT